MNAAPLATPLAAILVLAACQRPEPLPPAPAPPETVLVPTPVPPPPAYLRACPTPGPVLDPLPELASADHLARLAEERDEWALTERHRAGVCADKLRQLNNWIKRTTE